MPKRLPFTDEGIEEMRRMRRSGATLREIAATYRTSAATVLSYVRGIKRALNGQEVEWTSADIIYDWLPALPNEGLPLPRWISTWLSELLKTRSEKDTEEL